MNKTIKYFKLFAEHIDDEHLNKLGYARVHKLKEIENQYFLELNKLCNIEHKKNLLKLVAEAKELYPNICLKDYISPDFFTSELNISFNLFVYGDRDIVGIKFNTSNIYPSLEYRTFIQQYVGNLDDHQDLINLVLEYTEKYYNIYKEIIFYMLECNNKYGYLTYSLKYVLNNPEKLIVKTALDIRNMTSIDIEKEIYLFNVKEYMVKFNKTYKENTVTYNQVIDSDLSKYFTFKPTNGNETLIQVVNNKLVMLLPEKDNYIDEVSFIYSFESIIDRCSFDKYKDIICISILNTYLKGKKKSLDYLGDNEFLIKYTTHINNLHSVMTEYTIENILTKLAYPYLNSELNLFYVKEGKKQIFPQYIHKIENVNGSEFKIFYIHDKYVKMLNHKLNTNYPLKLYFKDNVRVSKKDYNLMKDAN